MPPVFVDLARHADHMPHPVLPRMIADQHLIQLRVVEPVGLGPARPAVDFNRRRVDDDVGNAAGEERAVQPEAVSAGFVATADQRLRRQREAPPGPGDLLVEHAELAGANGPVARALAKANGKGQFPVTLA